MKKTVNTQIAQTLFIFDEDAMERLENYLKSLEKLFEDHEDAAEILEDIESSLAQKLNADLKKRKLRTIDLKAVEAAIKTMGTPEQLKESLMPDAPAQQENSKVFARDPARRYIAGVSAGIARYFEIHVIWVRLAFVVTTFITSIGLIAYLILWLVMSEQSSQPTKKELETLKQHRKYLGIAGTFLWIFSVIATLSTSLFVAGMGMGIGMDVGVAAILLNQIPVLVFGLYLMLKLFQNKEPSKASALIFAVVSLLMYLVTVGGFIMSFGGMGF